MHFFYISNTAQLLTFVGGLTQEFEITEELATMHSVKGTRVTALFRSDGKLSDFWNESKIKWLKWILKLVLLHCITTQVLCKWVLKINNVAKIVNFIRARALNQSLLDSDLQSTSVSITAGSFLLLSHSPLSFVFRKLKDIQLSSFQAFHDPDEWKPTQTYWLNSDTVLAHFDQ